MLSQEHNLVSYSPFPKGGNAPNLSVIAYPVDVDGRPITPERLELHAKTHEFELPNCYHNLTTVISFNNTGGNHNISLVCPNKFPDKCSFNVDLSNILNNTDTVTFKRYDARSVDADDTGPQMRGRPGGPRSIEGIDIILPRVTKPPSGTRATKSDPLTLTPADSAMSTGSKMFHPALFLLENSFGEVKVDRIGTTPESDTDSDSMPSLESVTPDSDESEWIESSGSPDNDESDWMPSPGAMTTDSNSSESTPSLAGSNDSVSMLSVGPATPDEALNAVSSLELASTDTWSDFSTDNADQAPATHPFPPRTRSATLKRIARDLSKKLERWSADHPDLMEETISIRKDLSDLRAHCSAYSPPGAPKTALPLDLPVVDPFEEGDLCEPPCAICMYVRSDPTMTGTFEEEVD
ncbi:hypothetical protein C8R47DRAFT_1211027 [Mycena vitilis]|nr:hypothetical protein C8R47DRAFT_1211027 [Mycena vitilis]